MQPERLYSALEYESVFDGAVLRYENYANTIKESIVISAPQESYRYAFRMTLTGLTPVLQEDGGIVLTAADGSVIYTIPAPYLFDANGEFSYDAAYALERQGDAWLLAVVAEAAWLNDPARAFPVFLDPTITETADSDGQICAGFVRAGYPDAPDTSDTGLYVGSNGNSNGMTRSYFHIMAQDMISLPTGCEIYHAEFSLYHYAHAYESGSTPLEVGVYRLSKAASLTAGATAEQWKT